MDIEAKIKELTLEQKAALLQGWTEWTTYDGTDIGIPPVFLSDGPHGLRKQEGAGDHLGLNGSVPATCFPTAATMANSFDPELGEALGTALGEEALSYGVHVVLGPGLNMKRSHLCGRNFEYFSEDPIHAGKMAAAYVRGIQKSEGVGACPKHFAVNSQEERRMSVDSIVDERTLREIYLTGFEIAVKESDPKVIMTSYNRLNGEYTNESKHLITEILRKDWGFNGFVVTDWGGDNDHVEGVKAGSNLVMPAPGACCAREITEAVKAGTLSESDVDDRVRELLNVILPLYETAAQKKTGAFDRDAHHQVAKACALGSAVLLENDGILPLKGDKTIAVIGDFGAAPRYQGAGSSLVNSTKVDNLLDALKNAGAKVEGFAKGYERRDPNPVEALLVEAEELAKKAEIVVLCVGLDEISESEGLDRKHMNVCPAQAALMERICAANPNTVMVLFGGSPFEFPKGAAARAVIHGYLCGQAGALAMADLLLGKANPSGKLCETWPMSLDQSPSQKYTAEGKTTMEYREGPYIGYRYYETAGVPVKYCFGHGLSYTTFAYSDLQVSEQGVTFTLKNTGSMDGAEVAQLYVGLPGGKVFRPKMELKGFKKVFLKAGEEAVVTIPFDDKTFRYYDVKSCGWEVEGGAYALSVGGSIKNILLTGSIEVAGTKAESPYGSMPAYETGDVLAVDDKTFEALLGRPIPDGSWGKELERNDTLSQLFYAKSGVARLGYKVLAGMKKKSEDKGVPDLNVLFIFNMTFRALQKFAGGMLDIPMANDILFICNGHFFRGVGRLIRDFFRNNKANKAYMKALKGE